MWMCAPLEYGYFFTVWVCACPCPEISRPFSMFACRTFNIPFSHRSSNLENTKLLHQRCYRQEIAYTLTAHVVTVAVPMNKIHLWPSISTYRAFCGFLCSFHDGHLIIVYLFFHAPAPPGNANTPPHVLCSIRTACKPLLAHHHRHG